MIHCVILLQNSFPSIQASAYFFGEFSWIHAIFEQRFFFKLE